MAALSIENSITPLNSTALNQTAGLGASKKNELSQADFIELLVAQVKNQDPSKPLEPSQFMNQLAQFSTVNGVQELNNSFGTLSDKLASGQSIQAAALVGRTVMVPGGDTVLNDTGGITGQLELPQSSTGVTLKIYSARGELVRSLPMGANEAGTLQYNWDGFNDSGEAATAGRYRVTAEALIDGDTQAVAVSVATRIDSVTLDQDATGTPQATVLNLASGASVPLSTVQQIR
jgi:flagellar basal-body rod modification protein FlgD